MSDVDDLLRQLKPSKKSDDADLREALLKLWACFWASKHCAPGNSAHMGELADLTILFLRDWDGA